MFRRRFDLMLFCTKKCKRRKTFSAFEDYWTEKALKYYFVFVSKHKLWNWRCFIESFINNFVRKNMLKSSKKQKSSRFTNSFKSCVTFLHIKNPQTFSKTFVTQFANFHQTKAFQTRVKSLKLLMIFRNFLVSTVSSSFFKKISSADSKNYSNWRAKT